MVIRGYTSRVNIRIQPPGRAKQSLTGTRSIALADGDAPLVAICDYGLAGVATYVDRRARRRIQREARSDGQARTLDRAVDTFIGDIVQALKRTPGRYPHYPERHEWAAHLLATFFPDGALAITNLPYEEELVIVEYIHHHLSTEHRLWCRALRIEGLVDDLGEVLPAYREALTPDELISVDDVNAAFEQIQHGLCAAVAHVMARFWRVEDAEERERRLRPIFDQDTRIGELFAARRRSGADVPIDIAPGSEGEGEEVAGPGDGAQAEGEPGSGDGAGAVDGAGASVGEPGSGAAGPADAPVGEPGSSDGERSDGPIGDSERVLRPVVPPGADG